MYKLEYEKRVKKDLKKLDVQTLTGIKKELEELAKNPDNKSNVVKLQGNNPFYRLRVGDYRIIFERLNDRLVILVIRVGHRKEIYKKL